MNTYEPAKCRYSSAWQAQNSLDDTWMIKLKDQKLGWDGRTFTSNLLKVKKYFDQNSAKKALEKIQSWEPNAEIKKYDSATKLGNPDSTGFKHSEWR